MSPLTKAEKVTMMQLSHRYDVMLEWNMRGSQLKHLVDVVEEPIKKRRKAFVLITVLDANAFREYKVAAKIADVKIVKTLMEKDWLPNPKRSAESEENTTTPPKPPVTFSKIMAKSFLTTCGVIMIILFCNKYYTAKSPLENRNRIMIDFTDETLLFVFKLTGLTNKNQCPIKG